MFTFLNSLFKEDGFVQTAYNEMQALTKDDGPFIWMFDDVGKTVYGYLAYPDTDQSYDSDYPNYKDSKLTIFHNEVKKTVNENLHDKMFLEHFKSDIISNMQKDYELAINEILNFKKEGKKTEPFIKTVTDEIVYFKKELASKDWKEITPVVFEELIKMENSFHKKFGDSSKHQRSMGQPTNPLKWHGTLPQLCRLFYFTSKDHYKDIQENCYFDASRKEIEEFIHSNFVDVYGEKFEKATITKTFNPNEDRMNRSHKKAVKEIFKEEFPPNNTSKDNN